MQEGQRICIVTTGIFKLGRKLKLASDKLGGFMTRIRNFDLPTHARTSQLRSKLSQPMWQIGQAATRHNQPGIELYCERQR